MFQQITLLGRVGADAQLRYTQNGRPVLGWSLAVSVGWGDREKTLWFRCSFWGDRGIKLEQYIKKGTILLVVGELAEPSVWTGKDGSPRANLDVTVREVKLVGGRSQTNEAGDSNEPEREVSPLGDEEIPF